MQKKNGISLIVLVITIIVMIILAGSIILSLNNAGIIGKANEAVEKNNVNQVQTLAELKWADAYLENSKDLNGLKEKVLSELKQELGEDELAKYDIKFTGNGVKVRVYEDTSIPEDATEKLGADGKFKYVILSNGAIQITKYLGTATDIEIPAEYDGYEVYAVGNNETNIAEGKYYNIFGNKDTEINNTITSIKISRGIREIRDVAFEYCMGLTGELDIPDTIESIGAFAFNACSYTGNLKIPNSVTKIGLAAFQQCAGLNGILEWPNYLEYLGDYVFAGCSFTGTLTLPKNLTTIPPGTFHSCKFTGTLTLPQGITSIGEFAFYENKFTGKLSIPDKVTSIGKSAFESCSNFSSLELSNSLETIAGYAFKNCSNLECELVIPSSVTTIGKWAFYNCSKLSGTVTTTGRTIDVTAFNGCPNITKI